MRPTRGGLRTFVVRCAGIALMAAMLLAVVLLVVASFGLVSGCQPTPRPVPSPYDVAPSSDAGEVVAVLDDAAAPELDGSPMTHCGRACLVLRRFGCREASPTPNGTSCSDVCQNVTDNYPGMGLPADCVERAANITALRRCGVCKASP